MTFVFIATFATILYYLPAIWRGRKWLGRMAIIGVALIALLGIFVAAVGACAAIITPAMLPALFILWGITLGLAIGRDAQRTR